MGVDNDGFLTFAARNHANTVDGTEVTIGFGLKRHFSLDWLTHTIGCRRIEYACKEMTIAPPHIKTGAAAIAEIPCHFVAGLIDNDDHRQCTPGKLW